MGSHNRDQCYIKYTHSSAFDEWGLADPDLSRLRFLGTGHTFCQPQGIAGPDTGPT
jgi:hypothetical protein